MAQQQYFIKADKVEFSQKTGTYEKPINLTLDTAQEAVEIFYTVDGSIPDNTSLKYSNPIEISKNTLVKAVAWGKDYTYSEISQINYNIKAGEVEFSKAPGKYAGSVLVGLMNSSRDVNIFYTLDGSEPNKNSIKYNEQIAVNKNTTIKAIAIGDNYINSNISEASYVIMAGDIIFSERSNTFNNPIELKLSSLSEGVNIYYTLDGTDPDNSSNLYSAPIILSKNTIMLGLSRINVYLILYPLT